MSGTPKHAMISGVSGISVMCSYCFFSDDILQRHFLHSLAQRVRMACFYHPSRKKVHVRII